MNTEIELKYQLLGSSHENKALVERITTLLNTQKYSFEVHKYQLVNDYFDNNNLDLRKIDFGLRIRSKKTLNQARNKKSENAVQFFEQTIKTAGKVLNGLHKRPEYNVDIQCKQVDLSLFPATIWPDNTNLDALQQSLQVIFSTNFTRQTWLIHQDDSVIELALDQGEIFTLVNQQACDKRLAINEIEIELIRGNEQALFTLAKQLKSIASIELSSVSKAARGYAVFYEAKAER